MAKSLRSKRELRNRGIKRERVNGPAEKEREYRLAEKAQSRLIKEKAEQQQKDNSSSSEQMEVDDKKVSTSGWKGSRNDAYKKKKAKVNSALTFKKRKSKK